ncbi:helix-turn-helix protein [Salipiger aestuarii]|uniref:Helix-turn-helix protein n=1 Tax=Salipiger aestuarii TaxID=568098 RepID=A0A327XHQ9_9RHOB|nr:helix-turn-helix protein [Salipiger aestuarii]
MVGFIEAHRDAHGVEPICAVLPIAPSTSYDHLAKRADPARLSDRARRDEALRPEILRVFEENWRVYGVRKIWRQLVREGFEVARCTVARLMKEMGIQGIIRGKPHRTTIPDKKAPCPLDKVNRQFRVPAPNVLWVSDFTCVATWKGFVYVALRHRRLCPQDRRLACQHARACGFRHRRLGAGSARSPPREPPCEFILPTRASSAAPFLGATRASR